MTIEKQTAGLMNIDGQMSPESFGRNVGVVKLRLISVIRRRRGAKIFDMVGSTWKIVSPINGTMVANFVIDSIAIDTLTDSTIDTIGGTRRVIRVTNVIRDTTIGFGLISLEHGEIMPATLLFISMRV